MSLALRSTQEPRALVDTIQREVMAIDPEQPAYAVRTLDEILATSMARRRLSMLLLAVFSAVALLLAGVGICGVVAHSVSQEITKSVFVGPSGQTLGRCCSWSWDTV